MKSDGLKVLLIEPDKNQNELLTTLLIELNYQVISSRSMEAAVKRMLEHSPDVILCQKDLKEYNGFQLFSMFRNDMPGKHAPFILLLNSFNRYDFTIGIELGIDSFIFPPFEKEKIDNILQKQYQKSNSSHTDAIGQLQSFFDKAPFGNFILKNDRIIEANSMFFELIQKRNVKNKNFALTEIFNFNDGTSNELKLLRCLNGIVEFGNFKSIPLNSEPTVKFNIYLSLIKTGSARDKIFGLITPEKEPAGLTFPLLGSMLQTRNKTLKDDQFSVTSDEFFTNREKQVLLLSAQGAPVKQIAAKLGISMRTVEKHRSNIIRKTKTANITEAVFYANKKQLLQVG